MSVQPNFFTFKTIYLIWVKFHSAKSMVKKNWWARSASVRTANSQFSVSVPVNPRSASVRTANSQFSVSVPVNPRSASARTANSQFSVSVPVNPSSASVRTANSQFSVSVTVNPSSASVCIGKSQNLTVSSLSEASPSLFCCHYCYCNNVYMHSHSTFTVFNYSRFKR